MLVFDEIVFQCAQQRKHRENGIGKHNNDTVHIVSNDTVHIVSIVDPVTDMGRREVR